MRKWIKLTFLKIRLTLQGRKYIEFGKGKPRWKILQIK